MNDLGISCDACLKQFITSHRSQQNITPIWWSTYKSILSIVSYVWICINKRFVSFTSPCLLKYNSCTVKRPVWSVSEFQQPPSVYVTHTPSQYRILPDPLICLSAASMSTPSISHPTHRQPLLWFIYLFFATDRINMDLFVPGFYSTECYWDPSCVGVSEMIFF